MIGGPSAGLSPAAHRRKCRRRSQGRGDASPRGRPPRRGHQASGSIPPFAVPGGSTGPGVVTQGFESAHGSVPGNGFGIHSKGFKHEGCGYPRLHVTRAALGQA